MLLRSNNRKRKNKRGANPRLFIEQVVENPKIPGTFKLVVHPKPVKKAVKPVKKAKPVTK